MFLFLFFVILRCSVPNCESLGRSDHSRLLLCKLWEHLWPKAISPDLIWRWASRNQGGLFNIFLYHSLEWGEMEFDVTSLYQGGEKILEKVYYQGDWTCETLGGVFQPTQAFFASFSWMNFWYDYLEGCPLCRPHKPLAIPVLCESLLPMGSFCRLWKHWMVEKKDKGHLDEGINIEESRNV